MLIINSILYEQLAKRLVEAIDSRTFYSGSIEICTPEVDYRMEVTLLITYTTESYPEGERSKIANITPVWWEVHTTTDDGEQLNDFDFNILKHFTCQ